MSETQENTQAVLIPWETAQLGLVRGAEVRLSRGFLRCRPEKWFPGFAAQWLPLFHALTAEVRVQEVRPQLGAPGGLPVFFGATMDGEALAVMCDEKAAATLAAAVVPGALPAAGQIALEYLARRFFGSLSLSWSGPQSAQVLFDADLKSSQLKAGGAVKITLAVNGSPAEFWVVIGPALAEKFDGLWRRQLHGEAGEEAGPADISLEVAQLGVPPALIADYTRSGTVIDLAVPAADEVILRLRGKPWLPARLLRTETNFVIEILPGSVPAVTIPSGTTRLGIELGQFAFDPLHLAELAQPGAMIDTGIPLANQVGLVINRQQVAAAVLCTYQDRFAVSVA